MFFIHGMTGSLHLLAILNHGAISIPVQVFEHLFISFGCLPGSGNVESHGNFMVNVLRNCETVFPGS